MARAISFWNLQKMWAVICRDTIFLLVLVCSADLSRLFSLWHVKFYSFMFVHRNSSRVVCVNFKHPGFHKKNFPDSGFHRQ